MGRFLVRMGRLEVLRAWSQPPRSDIGNDTLLCMDCWDKHCKMNFTLLY